VRYAQNQWVALTVLLEYGELEIDNGVRNGPIARSPWAAATGHSLAAMMAGKRAAVLRSFIASCKRCGVEPFAWFRDVLSRIPAHSIIRLSELLPHNWAPAQT
jgi:transposase